MDSFNDGPFPSTMHELEEAFGNFVPNLERNKILIIEILVLINFVKNCAVFL